MSNLCIMYIMMECGPSDVLIPMIKIKIRPPRDHFIFIMGIRIPGEAILILMPREENRPSSIYNTAGVMSCHRGPIMQSRPLCPVIADAENWVVRDTEELQT